MNLLARWRRPSVGGAGTSPRQDGHLSRMAQWLFWAWAAQAGLAAFAAWWMQQRGLWRALVEGDPSGISVGIVLLTVVVTLWCGLRAWRLHLQAAAQAPDPQQRTGSITGWSDAGSVSPASFTSWITAALSASRRRRARVCISAKKSRGTA